MTSTHSQSSEKQEELAALKHSVERLMSDASDESAVRAVMETESGYDANCLLYTSPSPRDRG